MKVCEICGAKNGKIYNSKKIGKTLCAKCYAYEKNHPVNPLPEKGEVKYDEQGRLICHICGRAFKKLGSHAINGHDITAYEYKKMFDLNNNQGLLCESTKETLRGHVQNNYDKVIKENLIDKGSKTRFTGGCKGRTRDQVRLQCKKVLIQNTFKNKK